MKQTNTTGMTIHQLVINETELKQMICALSELGGERLPLCSRLKNKLNQKQQEICTYQTYLDAPTIQSMLASLREEAQGTEVKINYAKRKANMFWHYSLGRGSCTTESFVDLNFWRDDLRKERKHLANLVKQIKGLKAMLKDAV